MRFVSTEAMITELERKLKDCEKRLKTGNEAETRELEEEREKCRQLITLAKSNHLLW